MYEKFRNRGFVVLAVNVENTQDAFVVPLMRANRLSFVPLRGTRQFAEQAYNAVGMPANRLIDAQGRIMFQPSLITDDDQRTVELEVEALLASRR